MSWSRTTRSFKASVKVRSSRIGKRTHLEDATMRSACHRVIVEQDEGNITKGTSFYRGMTTEWMGMACSGRKFRMERVRVSRSTAAPLFPWHLHRQMRPCGPRPIDARLFVRPVVVENDMASHRRRALYNQFHSERRVSLTEISRWHCLAVKDRPLTLGQQLLVCDFAFARTLVWKWRGPGEFMPFVITTLVRDHSCFSTKSMRRENIGGSLQYFRVPVSTI